MPAPAPYDGQAGRISLGQIAQNIVANYKWLYRWSNEIGADLDLDLKKLAQLAFQHCRLTRDLIQPFVPLAAPLLDALESEFARHGMKWPTRPAMVQDLQAIYQECGALFTYVRDNVPEARSFATRTYDANGQEIEQATKVSKAHPVVTEVAKLRALFA